ncbi:MAG: precorrin-6A reductase [Stomatobaculum sp.]|nr:precorrin-6A reductase [Stomatobaculum sp.]
MTTGFGKILIFGGTTEGRKVAERLLSEGVPCTVSVATRYGEEVLAPHPLMRVRTGRMDRAGMAEIMREGTFCCVIDATHPHALAVSREIAAACSETGLPCLRLRRTDAAGEGVPAGADPAADPEDNACVYVRDAKEAGEYLSSVPGRVLVTTGSKELACFVNALGDPCRVTARVLPSEESLRACGEAGLSGKQIFAMQGPFDTDMNCALIRHSGASWLLTKETGAAGGYPEKIEAAKRCGIGTVVIRSLERGGYDLDQVVSLTLQYARPGEYREEGLFSGEGEKRQLSLVGIGVGGPEAVTAGAEKAAIDAEVLFGARSVLEAALKLWKTTAGKNTVPVYDSKEILEYLEAHPEVQNAAVVYSGDSGFYSGASSMLEKVRGRQDLRVSAICGISCVSWFAARTGMPWQDWKIISSHGRFCNVSGEVRRNRECFLLLSGAEDLRRTGAVLAEAAERGMLGDLQLICGYELSRPGEKIFSCSAKELEKITEDGLYVLYIRNDAAEMTPVLPGLPDTAFVRGKAPMTSAEIRALSLCRMGLTSKAVLWDVGAGTGSVSVEAALACPEGRVWSVEYKAEALALLTENRTRFCLQNMEIVEGQAPEALAGLPAPTHVFIGGSGGEIGAILDLVFKKNPSAKVVVNCITWETLSALQTALKRLPVRDVQCVQVCVNREEKLGNYHFLRAGNPVFVISFTGHEGAEEH